MLNACAGFNPADLSGQDDFMNMSQERIAHWFWRVLTGLVFAGTIAMLFMPPQRAAAQPAPGLIGTWRVALALPGGELPFNMVVQRDKTGPVVLLLNPPERMRAEEVTLQGNTLSFAFPSYGSRITLRLGTDGRLSGEANLMRSAGPATVAVSGVRGAWRFSPTPAKATANLSGRWMMSYGPRAVPSVLEIKQTGNRVSASVHQPSGDARYLAGEVSGNTLSLSTFDGNAATLWIARLDAGSLKGAQFTATGSKAGTAWTARRSATAKDTIEAVATEKPPVDRIPIRFPDSSGKMVSISDPAYKGKVVVVTLGGTWCPNCHDESGFMGPYAARRKKEGLEVVALMFEYGTDAPSAFRLMDRYKARYKLPYPLLLAGQPTPESSSAALPGFGPIKVYPTTLFFGRDGKLKEVHVGWAGPATGKLNLEAKHHFDETVTRLLRTRA
jgi:thiol-disulfide isomerase/thioredoxin